MKTAKLVALVVAFLMVQAAAAEGYKHGQRQQGTWLEIRTTYEGRGGFFGKIFKRLAEKSHEAGVAACPQVWGEHRRTHDDRWLDHRHDEPPYRERNFPVTKGELRLEGTMRCRLD